MRHCQSIRDIQRVIGAVILRRHGVIKRGGIEVTIDGIDNRSYRVHRGETRMRRCRRTQKPGKQHQRDQRAEQRTAMDEGRKHGSKTTQIESR